MAYLDQRSHKYVPLKFAESQPVNSTCHMRLSYTATALAATSQRFNMQEK